MDKEIKYAFVTGASGEIGQAICLSLARAGWNLYIHYYQNKQAVESLLPHLLAENVDVIPIQANFDDITSVAEMEKQVFSNRCIYPCGRELALCVISGYDRYRYN